MPHQTIHLRKNMFYFRDITAFEFSLFLHSIIILYIFLLSTIVTNSKQHTSNQANFELIENISLSGNYVLPLFISVCTWSLYTEHTQYSRFSVYLHNRPDWHSKGVSTVYCLLHCPRGLLTANGKEVSTERQRVFVENRDGGGRH
jgi:hypothetical protein